MNYTTNYHLPQWVETDRIMMEDFNQAMADIDAGIAGAKGAADAVEDAYTPDNKPYVVGSYTGNGSGLTVTLGFRPSFLIVNGTETVQYTSMSTLGSWNTATAGNVLPDCVTFTDTGFTVTSASSAVYPNLVAATRVYDYIAFR